MKQTQENCRQPHFWPVLWALGPITGRIIFMGNSMVTILVQNVFLTPQNGIICTLDNGSPKKEILPKPPKCRRQGDIYVPINFYHEDAKT